MIRGLVALSAVLVYFASPALGAGGPAQDSQARLAKLLEQAADAFTEGAGRRAEALYLQILEIDKDNVTAQKGLAHFYYFSGDIQKAQAAFERLRDLGAIDFRRSDKETMIYLGRCYLDGSRYAEAMFHFLRLSKQLPDDADVLYYLGQACSLLGRSSYGRIKEVDPEGHAVHLLLGENFLMQNQIDRAIVEFEAARKKNPGLQGINYQIGILHYQRNQLEEALEAFAAELKANPLSFDASLYAGIMQFEAALQTASASGKSERLASSIRYLERALAINAGSWAAHFYQGRALFETGRSPESLLALNEAARLDPDQPQTYYALAEVHRRLGDPRRADQSLARFRELKEQADRNQERKPARPPRRP